MDFQLQKLMIKFLKKYSCLIIVGILLTFIIIYHAIADEDITFVAGKYGKNCYIEGNQPKHIKYILKFDKYKKCLKYIGKNNE